MKKLLSIFFIFTITTLPAMAATQDCIDSQIADARQAFQFAKLPDSCKTSLMAKYNKSYKTPTVYRCNSTPDTCNIGDFPISCAPCAMDLLITPELDKFTKAYGQIACAAKNNDRIGLVTSTEAEKTQWVDQACNQIFSNGTAPTVESQSSTSSTETMIVSGTVFDENNEPLYFANIVIPGTTKCTTTDANGKFKLKDVPSNATLEISFLGYKSKTVNPGTNLKIRMESEAHIMDEVVVTACRSDTRKGIKSQENIDGKCYPSACVEPRWTLSGTKKEAECVEQKCNIKNGTGEWTADGGTWKCSVKSCNKNYKENTEKNKCTKPGEPDTDGGDDQTQQNEPRLSEADSLAKIDELRDNADAMKANEQSTANKLLGATGMGSTGIGGMQMASAMAEENADADAEAAMRAYLATFHCNYGAGKNIPGGERDVELPGGNELIGLYSEYVNLANDLKIRKTALDMRPGIESEPILDAATSGLYDDVAIGKTSGAYTSLARALMDPNGADAAAWAAQKAETADKKKTGMITAGIGAGGSLVGNLAINSGKAKQNKVDEILNKYDKKKQLLDNLQSDVAIIPPQTAACPDGTTGTAHPDCTCTDTTKIYNPNTHACEECVGGQTVQNGKCECPTDKPLWDNRISQCIAEPTTCTPQCTPTDGDHLIVQNNCSCTCSDGYTYENEICTCTGENKKIGADGKCQTIETKTIVEHISTLTTTTVENASLPTGSLFKVGSYELVDAAKNALNTFITGLYDAGYTNCKITIDGYTDPLGSPNTNKTLSQNRADAVKQHIEGLKNSAIESVTAVGHGEIKCTCGAGKSPTDTDGKINGIKINYNDREYSACSGKDTTHTLSGDARYAPCRRVEITADCKQITTVTEQQ